MHVDYDRMAAKYGERFVFRDLSAVGDAVVSLARDSGAEVVLEVGCGTGHWLAELQSAARQVVGLDLSSGMLGQARQQEVELPLTRGRASQLPFADVTFDLVLCVQSIHHFDHPHAFVGEARRVLKPGGVLAVIGMDPHSGGNRWYVWDYFEGTLETDLERFPAAATIIEWMDAVGFEGVEARDVERIAQTTVGRGVLEEPFLQKHAASQLALLTDDAYAAGLRRIELALDAAEAAGVSLLFPVDLTILMTTGHAKTERGIT